MAYSSMMGMLSLTNLLGTLKYTESYRKGSPHQDITPKPVATTGPPTTLFIIDQSYLYRVNPETGDYCSLPGSWHQVKAMTSCNGFLYINEQSSLYKVDPESGSYECFPGNWSDVKGMASCNGSLYVNDQSSLYKVCPETGSYECLSGTWAEVKSMTGC